MSDRPKAFAITPSEGVTVHVDDSSEDETFVLSLHKDDAEVEKHEGVTAESVVGLASDHFSAEHVDPPSADDAE